MAMKTPAALLRNLKFAPAFRFLFQRKITTPDGRVVQARYKVAYGGRGGAKSWGFARAAIVRAMQGKVRILCARELQSSMKDSVHKLLADQIDLMGLSPWFTVLKDSIRCKLTGSEFLFKGLRLNPQEIKSTEGIDICWVEEAHAVSAESWLVLDPTIRKPGSEIWISFNPADEQDPTYQQFVLTHRENAIVRKIGFEDNPWFPSVLDVQRLHMLENDPNAYEWVWGGTPRKIAESVIFNKRVVFDGFETPEDARFYFGADWGFANDPTALIRCFIEDLPDGQQDLFIDYEAFGEHVELDELPAMFRGGKTPDGAHDFLGVPGADLWPIKADGARPETISMMAKQGFHIVAAEKWPGSVEDGIAHLKAFRRIIIHPRCKRMSQEARLYSYKVDKKTGDILPVVVDAHNHGWDALRYALDGIIIQRGSLANFMKAYG